MPKDVTISYLSRHLSGRYQVTFTTYRTWWQRVGLRLAHPMVACALLGTIAGTFAALALALALCDGRCIVPLLY